MGKERPQEPPSWASPQEWHNFEDAEVYWQDHERWQYDHEGRPKIDHCPQGNNLDRHLDNLSRFTGWYDGHYYHDGVIQNGDS